MALETVSRDQESRSIPFEPGDELPVVSVLIVDDDDESREVLADMVEAAGYTVATASNGREGIRLLQQVRPELILLDIRMPIMDGAEFREEQRRHPSWLRIPTIVMTGGTEEPQLDLAVERTLHKPVRARELFSLVDGHCKPSR